MSVPDELPFEKTPDTPEHLAREADLNAAVEGLIDRLLPLYAPDGELPRETPYQAIMSAAGTLMLRVAAAAALRGGELTGKDGAVKSAGDAGILLARTAGYFVTSVPKPLLPHLLPVMVREMASCAGAEVEIDKPDLIIRP